MAAACYMALGRLIWYVTPVAKLKFRSLCIAPRRVAPLFVTFDLGAFFIQFLGICAIGSAYTSTKTPDAQKLESGIHLLKFGLVVQLFCFGLFAVIGTRFLLSSRRWRTEVPREKWVRLTYAINGAATLIMVSLSDPIRKFIFPLIEYVAARFLSSFRSVW
jgi:hypothetical protein